jgi:hypothetical protein
VAVAIPRDSEGHTLLGAGLHLGVTDSRIRWCSIRASAAFDAAKFEASPDSPATMQLETIALTRPVEALRALQDLSRWASGIHLAYAWASSSEGKADHWRALPLDKIQKAVFGIHFAQTEPEVIRAFLSRPTVLRVVEDTAGVFHPKVILGVRGDEARAIVGSSNLTKGGFFGNTELNLLLRGSIKDAVISRIIQFIDEQWSGPRSFSPTPEWLTRYESVYASRPLPPQVPGPVHAPAAINTHYDLDVDWARYYALIAAQERRTLSNRALIHVFDHEEGSYLEEAESCRIAFAGHPDFAAMPLDERQLVSGWGRRSSGYFGRMTGAGYFKQLVSDQPTAIARHLDRVPLSGAVSEADVARYFEGMLAIRGVSLATGSRLLCVKRPDLFLPFNGANKRRIREVFGPVPEKLAGYLDLHLRIWSLRWIDSVPPTETSQLRVWTARVALLDALLYEAPSVGSPPPGRVSEVSKGAMPD